MRDEAFPGAEKSYKRYVRAGYIPAWRSATTGTTTMGERTTDDEGERLPVSVDAADRAPTLADEIVAYEDRPAECTIFPPEASGPERMTTWITARAGSFVGLDDAR